MRDRVTPLNATEVFQKTKACFESNMEFVFDPLDWQDEYPDMDIGQAEKAALSWRGNWARHIRKLGIHAIGTSLRGQLRPYKGFGEPDGRVRTVYYLRIVGFGE